MMGLHRLDAPPSNKEVAPTILPPEDWTELEERRRLLWGAFCIDSHASISTGWPTLIDPTQVSLVHRKEHLLELDSLPG